MCKVPSTLLMLRVVSSENTSHEDQGKRRKAQLFVHIVMIILGRGWGVGGAGVRVGRLE